MEQKEFRETRRVPPYVSFVTLTNFVEKLRKLESLPGKIDRSQHVAFKLSGSTAAQLHSALIFIGLLDEQDRPTEKLRKLVSSEGTEACWRTLFEETYRDILARPDISPDRATLGQLEEEFRSVYGVRAASVLEKCLTFYIRMAEEAGISHPHVRAIRSVTRKTAQRPMRRTKWPSAAVPATTPEAETREATDRLEGRYQGLREIPVALGIDKTWYLWADSEFGEEDLKAFQDIVGIILSRQIMKRQTK